MTDNGPFSLLIADVDGCLLPEESVAWDPKALQPLAEWCHRSARGEGGLPRFTLCTGRPQPYVEALMKLLDVRLPAICESGAVFYTLPDNRAWYGPGVTPAKLRKLRELQNWLETDVLPAEKRALLQFGKMAQLSVYSEQHAVLEELAPRVSQFAEGIGLALDVHTSHYYLNISLDGVTKGRALEALMEQLGATREETAGIGDTEGDLPLREHVAFFACPSNARQAIKNVADFVASRPIHEGVLEIFQQIEQRERD